MSVVRALARTLERGRGPRLSWVSPLLVRGPIDVRPLSETPSWGVFGATLGGSWKTPVAIELCRRLAAEGRTPVLVGHAYHARPGRARRVTVGDTVDEVGDEARLAARSLASPVVVAPSRASAVAFASRLGDVLVLDGTARAHHRVLALDAAAPWGSGCVVPEGDLRAEPRILLDAATHAARVTGDLSLPDLAERRPAVVTCIARPARFVSRLAHLSPTRVVELPDHAGPSAGRDAERLLRGAPFDVVLVTEKCRERLPPLLLGRPVVAVPVTPRFALCPVSA